MRKKQKIKNFVYDDLNSNWDLLDSFWKHSDTHTLEVVFKIHKQALSIEAKKFEKINRLSEEREPGFFEKLQAVCLKE